MTRRLLAPLAVLTLALAGCGDDDADTGDPDTTVMTNEFGVETFEPGEDNPWFEPETLEPEAD
jgi:hypothetical protein